MTQYSLISSLKERLQQPLPGKTAQYKMATSTRIPYQNKSIPQNAKLASVLCLLYPKQNQWYLPLIQRVTTVSDTHSGQISFPGGKLEPSDPTKQAAAIREAEEEIGIQAKDVTVLGKLTSLYIPASNFKVFPYVGFMNYKPEFYPQETEVDEVVEVPLNQLIAPSTLKYKSMSFRNQFTVKDVPYFDVESKVVWGATSMILSEFIEIVNQVKSSTI